MRREPRWVGVFLKQLERSGNVRLAAEGAGVDYTTAYQRRKRHGAFAERWEGALRLYGSRSGEAGGALHAGSSTIPSAGNGPPPSAGIPPAQSRRRSLEASSAHPGEELIGRPDGKLIRASEARWSPRKEEKFLLELTMSGSVKLAAKAAGFSTAALYKRRLKDKRFAAAWEAAVETGKARVQAYLIEAATRTFDPDELPIGDDEWGPGSHPPDGRSAHFPRVSIAEAINIAKLKAAAPPVPDEGEEIDEDQLKEVRERILEKLERLQERDREELGGAGWIEWQVPPRPDGGESGTVWLPPEYRLVGPEAASIGSGQA